MKDKFIVKIEKKFKVPDRVADKIKNVAEKVKGGICHIGNYPALERPEWSLGENGNSQIDISYPFKKLGSLLEESFWKMGILWKI